MSGGGRWSRHLQTCWLLALVTGAALAADSTASFDAVRADEARRVAVFTRAAKSVVCIFGDRTGEGGGSGVIIDEAGFGLTNFHVVAPFLEKRRGYGGLNDGRLYPLEVLGIDPGGDIAMFKLSGRQRFDPAPLGDSDQLAVGQWVAAMGNPFLVAEDYTPTITVGIISGLHRYQEGEGNLLEYADCIQVSTSINPGNSGGPLFDLEGRVIGINGRASFEERGRVNVGLGYAVTINQVKRFIPPLRAGLLCHHGTLGATVQAAGDDLIFDALQALSPAETAGIQLGDVLVSIDGRRIHTTNEYNNQLAILPADWPVQLVLERNGQRHTLAARLEKLPSRLGAPFIPDPQQAQREIHRILNAAAGSLAPTEDGSAIEWAATVKRQSATTRVRGTQYRDRLELLVEDGVNETIALDAEAASDDAHIWQEWLRVTQPLVHGTTASLDWKVRATDRVAGGVATVIERRYADDRWVQWITDWPTDVLREARLGQDDVVLARWTPQRATGDETSWPRTWERRSVASGARERTITLTFGHMERTPTNERTGDG